VRNCSGWFEWSKSELETRLPRPKGDCSASKKAQGKTEAARHAAHRGIRTVFIWSAYAFPNDGASDPYRTREFRGGAALA
jgi:hypothetical protein